MNCLLPSLPIGRPLTALLILSIALTPLSAWATLKLPSIFGDQMVLQRDCELPVWGKADPGETVVVRIGTQTAETTADDTGKWIVRFPPMPADGKSLEMEVKGSQGKTVLFQDVLLGDVWICSGQSNMGMGVGAVLEKDEILGDADQPGLRLFQVSRNVAFSPSDDLPGKWVVSSPQTIFAANKNGFSAIGYQFGKAIHQHIKVPVGMIQSAVGGTRIEAWSSLETLQSLKTLPTTQKRLKTFLQKRETLPERQRQYETELLQWQQEYKAAQEEHRRLLDTWRADTEIARQAGQPLPKRPASKKIPNSPLSPEQEFFESTVLFNGMIAPLIPYGIRGVLWYQGEANAYPHFATEYREQLPALILDWRERWGLGPFPFLYVQLPNLNGHQPVGWSMIRDAQRQTLTLPGTAMVVALDAGDPNDIHPGYKKPIAERLVLAARGIAYGEPIVYSGPLLRTTQKEEEAVRLTFNHVGKGLIIGSGPELPYKKVAPINTNALHGFEVAGEDQHYHPATAEIAGEEVILRSPAVPTPRWARYGWGFPPDPAPNLYNQEGLPASPFVSEATEN